MTAQPDQIRSHARNVLQDVLQWSLTADRWAEISAILDNLETGLGRAGPDQLAAIAEASLALELSAPLRLTEIDKPPAPAPAPAPDSVRERVNVLIHKLTPPAWQGTDETSGAAG